MSLNYCPKRAKIGYPTAKAAAIARSRISHSGLDIFMCHHCRMFHLGRPRQKWSRKRAKTFEEEDDFYPLVDVPLKRRS